jgi:hypothetical protein
MELRVTEEVLVCLVPLVPLVLVATKEPREKGEILASLARRVQLDLLGCRDLQEMKVKEDREVRKDLPARWDPLVLEEGLETRDPLELQE